MKNRVLSVLTGFVITLMISGFSFFYLYHLKTKKTFKAQSPYLDIVETMDQRFNDLKYKFIEKKVKTNNVVLLAIDDESIKEIGRWPWGRDVISDMANQLVKYNVSAIGMDVIFSEPQREAPQNDLRLGSVIKKDASKIVLGTFSNQMLKVLPYQDYCVNEAFIASGGDQLVKINPSFVVDDLGDTYDDLKWSSLFSPLFKAVQEKSESQYLEQLKKKSASQLSHFQKNYLASKKLEDTFNYCALWLTPQDELFINHRAELESLYVKLFNKKTELQDLSLDQKLQKFKNDITELPVPQYGEWQTNIAPLQEPSQYTGSFVTYLDLDGYVRRYPLFYRSGNRLGTSFIPSLALQSYLAATGYRADVKIEKIKDQKVITAFTIMDPSQEPEKMVQELPVDSQGRMIINYYGPEFTLPYVSAKELFSEDEDISVITRTADTQDGKIILSSDKKNKKEFFKGKTVIVGTTALAIYDLRNTPVAANYPGPEIHQTILTNLFDQQYIRRLDYEQVWLPLGVIFLGLLLSYGLSFMGATQTVLCMVFTTATLFWIDHLIFKNFNVLFSSFFLVFEVPMVSFSVLVFKYSSEERKKNELRKTFSKYVSPAVVDELLKDDENIKLGGRKQELTVFFSDVRGFTEFSEKMDPQALSQFLNEYLTPMTEMVFNNKGTLDKYMGDGLMAFFGAPVFFKDHAACACRCALQSIENLKKLQIEFKKRQWPNIDIGIGINTGPMSVGNMGSQIVQSYTVIGDAVNLGSRLESANKEYGTRILISETTHAAIKDQFITREVDRVRVKGKKEPVKAFELIAESVDSATQDWLKAYEQAYLSYQKQHFEVAEKQFARIVKESPFDTVAKMYVKRCKDYSKNPPADEWDGVYEMKAK